MALLLLVEDELLRRRSLREWLVRAGHSVLEAGTLAEAGLRLRQTRPGIVLLDMHLPDGNGIDFLASQKETLAGSPVIVVTAGGSVEDAVRALKLGAAGFLSSPVDHDELLRIVDEASRRQRDGLELEVSRRAREKQSDVKVVAESESMRNILEAAAMVAAESSTPVLIHGETGTGKRAVARFIHGRSSRAGAPLQALHCAVIPEHLIESELFGYEKGAFPDARASRKGLLELADAGTVILDEIGEFPLLAQARLLRFLEGRSFCRLGGTREIEGDVRVIATTRRDLAAEVATGRFREDLYRRLNGFPIEIPPLRTRRDDILPLALAFIHHFASDLGKPVTDMTPELRGKLMSHPWNGNVRELRNLIERAVILEEGDTLTARFLPFNGHAAASTAFGDESILPLEEVEFIMVQRALRAAHGNQSQAARLLQVSRDQLRYRVKRYRELGRLSADLVTDEVLH